MRQGNPVAALVIADVFHLVCSYSITSKVQERCQITSSDLCLIYEASLQTRANCMVGESVHAHKAQHFKTDAGG